MSGIKKTADEYAVNGLCLCVCLCTQYLSLELNVYSFPNHYLIYRQLLLAPMPTQSSNPPGSVLLSEDQLRLGTGKGGYRSLHRWRENSVLR